MKGEKDKDLSRWQRAVQDWVREYGPTAAVAGTGLPLCDVRRTYTDTHPVHDHLMRVYNFYLGMVHQATLAEDDLY
ncbi:MAG: hypothetical protein JSS76_15200 [Bacteroidetes bacterium]|nr:hypothetical protein [Bacteroidota bacterium]MBS1686090.1 hypothetical protein [Bacteroidota bacterium]